MNIHTYDYIVVGGGSAGSVMAGRLSEDAGTSVALLEAGGKGDSWVVKTPAAAVAMLPTSINNHAFQTVPQKGLNGRRGYQPRGKCLGGSSAINAMIYTRGHRSDYDHWAALGNVGWSYDDLLPYFKKSENNAAIKNQRHHYNQQRNNSKDNERNGCLSLGGKCRSEQWPGKSSKCHERGSHHKARSQ